MTGLRDYFINGFYDDENFGYEVSKVILKNIDCTFKSFGTIFTTFYDFDGISIRSI